PRFSIRPERKGIETESRRLLRWISFVNICPERKGIETQSGNRADRPACRLVFALKEKGRLAVRPRGMNIDPREIFFMPPTRTPNIAVFRIQPVNGRLRFSTLVNTPTPVDVEFG